MFVDNLKLDVIATYNDNEQEMFKLHKIKKDNLDCEGELLDLIKGRLDYSHHENLVKLSLCWECPKEYSCIKESIFKDNGKYFFGSWAENRKEVK